MILAHEDEIHRQLSQLFEGMMHHLFQEDGASLRIGIVCDKPVQDFITGHAKVLDSSFEATPMSDIMRSRLQQSDYIFSGIKTFHELNEAFPSLIDENGNRKPFGQFLNDVQIIDQTYNRNYLRAEYNFCQASSQMAANWEQIEADGDRYNLQYRTAGDDKVRPEHEELNGVTLPPSDPFWRIYYPPNGWNCRCTAIQVRKSKFPETPHDEAMQRGQRATAKDTRGIFQFNSGIQQKAFPDYNPYTIRRCNDCDLAKATVPDGSPVGNKLAFVPDNELCTACRLLHQCVGDRTKTQAAIERKHYLHEMEPLLSRKVTVYGNGHEMRVGFNKYGNKHLFSDTFNRCHGIRRENLADLDRILTSATFVTKAGLSKPRTDDIKRFYYYQATINGHTVYLNVAETDFQRPNGKIYHSRFLYSVTDQIKE